MLRELEGRVALVTGGSKGIGKAIAASFASEGAKVMVAARGSAALESTAKELSVLSVVTDVRNPKDVERAVEFTVERFGRIDILVNNAGGADHIAEFSGLTKEDWFDAFELNLMSVVYSVQHALPHLKKSGHGRIINIASISGVEPGLLVPHYSAAKAGVINLTKHLANVFAADGILVNVICPAQVHSDSRNQLAEHVARTKGIPLSEAIADIDVQGAARIPLGRIGEPNDVAGLVTFLASDKASWITGACFHVDGGKCRGIR